MFLANGANPTKLGLDLLDFGVNRFWLESLVGPLSAQLPQFTEFRSLVRRDGLRHFLETVRHDHPCHREPHDNLIGRPPFEQPPLGDGFTFAR